jgi:peptidoglycan/xylan/chitin deacetylase (PgdA/CDA1 family)
MPADQWVDQVIRAHDQAHSLQDWVQSGWHPDSLVKRIHCAPDKDGTDSRVCRSLRALKNHELALFDPWIAGGTLPLDFGCRAGLKARLKKHWGSERRALEKGEGPLGAPVALVSTEQAVDGSQGGVYFRAGLKDHQMALTFDDGPDTNHTMGILDALHDWGVRATFFQIGNQAVAQPQLTRLAIRQGHTVASHTRTHALLTDLSTDQAMQEVRDGRDLVQQAAAPYVIAPFFRFPYGARTDEIQEEVSSLGLSTFFWNMDSLDWKLTDPQALLKQVRHEMAWRQGGILVFHEALEQTSLALPYVLKEVATQGWTTVVFVSAAGGR